TYPTPSLPLRCGRQSSRLASSPGLALPTPPRCWSAATPDAPALTADLLSSPASDGSAHPAVHTRWSSQTARQTPPAAVLPPLHSAAGDRLPTPGNTSRTVPGTAPPLADAPPGRGTASCSAVPRAPSRASRAASPPPSAGRRHTPACRSLAIRG